MKPCPTPSQMRDADALAIAELGSADVLIERAGAAVAFAALGLLGGSYGRRVTLLAGKGNNGEDAREAAARMSKRGVHVTVFDTGTDLPEDLLRWTLSRSDLAIDGMVGTGGTGGLRGPALAAAEILNSWGGPVLAIDIPSGVDGETGEIANTAVRARLTVAMGALKPGLLLMPGAQCAGEVSVADIGIEVKTGAMVAEFSDLKRLLKPRPRDSNKRSVGKVLVVAGSRGMSGAAALSSLGAARAGAGYVRLATSKDVASALDASIPEVIVSDFASASEIAKDSDAVVLGPGLGRTREVQDMIRRLVMEVEVPLVLDADGLNAFEGALTELASRGAPTVITPHTGELSRLTGRRVDDIEKSRIEAAKGAAKAGMCVAALKGSPTIVAEPGGKVVIVTAGNPLLSTAGTGDVLSGVIGAFATEVGSFDAAWAGALVHGLAADTMIASHGDRGLSASHLADLIPRVISG